VKNRAGKKRKKESTSNIQFIADCGMAIANKAMDGKLLDGDGGSGKGNDEWGDLRRFEKIESLAPMVDVRVCV